MEEIEQCGYQIDKCPDALQLNAKVSSIEKATASAATTELGLVGIVWAGRIGQPSAAPQSILQKTKRVPHVACHILMPTHIYIYIYLKSTQTGTRQHKVDEPKGVTIYLQNVAGLKTTNRPRSKIDGATTAN